MKSMNFPARKLRRKILAEQRTQLGYMCSYTDFEKQQLADARMVRTKKYRGK